MVLQLPACNVLADDRGCLVSGIDTKTGATVQVQRPANFYIAVEKLGLQHALGSLQLLKLDVDSSVPSNENVNMANLPAEVDSSDKHGAAEGQDTQEDEGCQRVPLQLQLGLPLTPAELCNLVCR